MRVPVPRTPSDGADASALFASSCKKPATESLFSQSELARGIRSSDDYDRLAIAGASNALMEARRAITAAALSLEGRALDSRSEDALAVWLARRQAAAERTIRDLADIAGAGELSVARLTVAASRLADLAKG